MSNPFRHTLSPQAPVTQSARLEQVENNTGGFVFALDVWKRLERFLILGTDGGTYYATEAKLTLDNLKVVEECLRLDGPRAVRVIADISTAGRAPRNSAAIFALVMALKRGDDATRAQAAQALPAVCRTGTHILEAASYVKLLGGWGRQTRRAFADWYTGKGSKELVYQLLKYQQREGWAQRDVLRLAHPDPKSLSAAHQSALRWAVKGTLDEAIPNELWQLTGFEHAKRAESPAQTAKLIRDHQLPRECVKSEHLTSPEVWEALLYTGMPLHALMRNLPTMTRVGLLAPLNGHVNEIRRRFADLVALRRSRLHPMNILMALTTYRAGKSLKGSHTWTAVPEICTILDDAFYAAFGNVESTGKRIMMALDVSGSMGVQCAGLGISAREASAAMAMVTMAREPRHYIVGFENRLTPLDINPKMRLPDVVNYMERRPFGSTDCSLPFEYARQHQMEVDAFIVFTDSETNTGIHPFAALQRYRKEMGIPAKLIVNGMTSTGFTIAKPDDPGMLDLVGLDSNMPALISDFIRN